MIQKHGHKLTTLDTPLSDTIILIKQKYANIRRKIIINI